MYNLPETVSENGSADISHRRNSRAIAIKELPSNNFSTTEWDILPSLLKQRAIISECFKMRRSSNLSRHVSISGISGVAEIMETLLENQSTENALEHLKGIRAKLSVKKEVKSRFLSRRMTYWELEQRPFSLFQYRMKNAFNKTKEYLLMVATLLELWNGHIKSVHGIFGSGIASYFVFLRWLLFINILNFLTVLSFIVLPHWIYALGHNYGNRSAYSFSFKASDLLTGSGSFNDTVLYYGHYADETRVDVNYDMPVAYLLTVVILGFLNLIAVAKSLAAAYKGSSKFNIDYRTAFCHALFCGWDCGIETQAAAELKQHCIFRKLLELLCRVHKGFVRKKHSENVLEWAFAIFINIFILSLMFGFGSLVYFIQEDEKAVQINIPVLDQLSRPLTMTTIAIGFYILLTHMSRFEYFVSKETHLYLTLIRISVMRNAIIAVLLYFRLSAHEHILQCSENVQGQEIYRFIVINFLIMTVLYSIALHFWKLLSIWIQRYNYKINPPQFDVAIHTNDLIYYQTLVWIGTFYSPMISLVFIFVIILNFYGMLYTMKQCCKPDPKAWLPSFAHMVFICITFLCFLLSAIETGYVFTAITPSSTCGPFTNKPTVYSALEEWYSSVVNEHVILRVLATLLNSPVFILILILFLCIAIQWAKSHATATAHFRKYLEQQVSSEGKDKAYLLKIYEDALNEGQKKEKTLRMRLKSISMKN